MKIKTALMNSLFFLFLICLIPNSRAQIGKDATSAIKEANKEFMETFNSGDAKAMAGGVAKSTIPAMAGLMAAIPATFASRILEQKAKKQSDLLQEHLTFE